MSQPEVTIDQGRLRGSIAKNIREDDFLKFKGIPYAKPPLGKLRFKAPQPPENWSGIFDATKEGDACYSADLMKNGEISGSENCLVLNIYTKKLSDGTNLSPVLFWIHGGGFVWGSSTEELYGPDFLLTEDVVLVTINYRLGLLGFVNFEDPSLEIPGNAGLKDQVMALKWVQKNIDKFGGDPNNVTIFGESAGAASVHLLTLSSMAKGLFHKAIAQSGCALNSWAQGIKGSKLVAKAMDLEGVDERTIYNSLMEKSVEEIFKIQQKIGDSFMPYYHRPFGVVVEKNSSEPFLDDEPINVIKSGKFSQVPFIIGHTLTEGMVYEHFKNLDDPEGLNWENVIPWTLGYEYGSPESKSVAKKIKKFYLGNEEYSESFITKKFDVFTDASFIQGIYPTITNQLLKSSAPAYFYRVSLETNLNFFKKLIKVETPGVCHCDDVGYLFTSYLTPEIEPESDEDISMTKFVKLWTNSAKFGNPTPEKDDVLLKTVWKPVASPDLEYLDIGKELVSGFYPDIDRVKFWKGLTDESPAGKKL